MAQSGFAPIQPGDVLAGKYRVERVLGVGGMGVVVAARHEQLGQLVAIKFVRDDALSQGDAVERFLREARAAVKLRSEHVARVLDVGTLPSGSPYMVMEYLDGSDLGQILADGGPMPVERAVLLVLQACEAVAEAHVAGIVHRDLKPQNLFLTHTVGGSPCLKVLDFGVSKSVGMMSDGHGALTRTRHILGSPLYMAPEQMRSSRDVDARADVWALGVVLFELLTRRWPFEAESLPELCLKVVTESPQSLVGLRPDVSPAMAAIVEKCLQKDPSQRFTDAGELAGALAAFASSTFAQSGSRVARITFPSIASAQVSLRERAPSHAPTTSTLPSASPSVPFPGGSQTPAVRAPSTLPAPSPSEVATPAAWGSRHADNAPGAAPAGRTRRPILLWAMGAAALAAFVVVVSWPRKAALPTGSSEPSPHIDAPHAQLRPAPSDSAAGASLAPAVAQVLAPSQDLPSAVLQPRIEPSDAGARVSSNAPPRVTNALISQTSRTPPPVLAPASPGRASPGARSGPKSSDDDIPSLR